MSQSENKTDYIRHIMNLYVEFISHEYNVVPKSTIKEYDININFSLKYNYEIFFKIVPNKSKDKYIIELNEPLSLGEGVTVPSNLYKSVFKIPNDDRFGFLLNSKKFKKDMKKSINNFIKYININEKRGSLNHKFFSG